MWYFFRLEKKYLIEEKLISRIKHLSLKNISEYIYYLKFHPAKAAEAKILYDIITINETSFFRNEPQLEAFEKELLPQVLDQAKTTNTQTLKIWSAGCSSGEEPYTLSIILHRVLSLNISKWFIDILASDINDSVLEKAKTGIYTDYALRNTDQATIGKHFDTLSKDNHRLKESYRKNIRFLNINLLDNKKTSTLPLFDIIFCRNVFIYFDITSKMKVINMFYEHLRPEGYLFLGHSESLHGISASFKLMLFKGALAYKKE